ncbi:unnamed protein product [Paramecium sonneborni]|uniref:Uncharacterized protein n=1 Tax=Paramecium sonneborni TaxID=65129 RepID=A0A8S1NY94_9CILI|nr:unnamed protein product [Paramecium sonneborni]
MINKASSFTIRTVRMFKMLSKNQIRFQYGKLEHFFANYEMSEFESPNVIIDKFQFLIDDLFYSNSLQFNNSLAFYLNVNDVEIRELIMLLEKIYQNSQFLSKTNKLTLIQIIQTNLHSFNEDIISIINQACLLGIVNEQIMQSFINQFILNGNIQYDFTIQVKLIYIFGQTLLKYNSLIKNEEFIKKWQDLIKYAIQNHKPEYKISGCMFSQISFLIKGLCQIEQEQEATYLGQIIKIYKNYYKYLMSNFSQNLDFYNMTPKETTILITALLKLREQFSKLEIIIIIQSILNRVKKIGISSYSDIALQSFVFNLTYLGDYQKFMVEDIIQVLQQKAHQQTFSPKILIIILFEMHIKWNYDVPKDHLLNLIPLINIKEIPDFELGNYFQLLTLLPLDSIQHIINNIEPEMAIREQFQKENQQFYKKESLSTDRMKRSILRLINLLTAHGKNAENLQRTIKLIL